MPKKSTRAQKLSHNIFEAQKKLNESLCRSLQIRVSERHKKTKKNNLPGFAPFQVLRSFGMALPEMTMTSVVPVEL